MKSKLFLTGLGALSLFFLCAKACHNGPNNPDDTKAVLLPDQKAKIVQKGHNLTVVTKGKDGKEVVKEHFTPGPVTIITDDKGNVKVKVKQFGVSLDPGIGAAFYRDKLLLSTDLRIVYLHRFSLHGALLWSPTEEYVQDIIKPAAFVSYALPYKKFSNTSVFAGITIGQSIIAGVRLGF
jgi:hypothetical protein